VPFLNLSGDCVDAAGASREQHATRAEAFIESLALGRNQAARS
jgi:benzoyl-CoA reductase/2-hydroxyglutaryl-CoA dehydratase subunit BcrC/BadD/HgdB